MNCPGRRYKSYRFYKTYKSERGQALIVILLVSVIGLTIGLTLASRSTEETNITTELEESSRAFSAAEAGLEESIQHIGEGVGVYTGSLGSTADFNVHVEIAGGQAGAFQFPGEIKNNQPVTVWLTGHDSATGDIDIDDQYGKSEIYVCWGEATGDEAGLEMTLYFKRPDSDPIVDPETGQTTIYGFARAAYNSAVIQGATPATGATGGDCSGNYKYKTEPAVDFQNMKSINQFREGTDKLLYLKIRPVFNPPADPTYVPVTRIGVYPEDSSTVLPTQGEIHTSTGMTASGHQTKIVQFISHPGPPELFDAVIYSEQVLSK